MVTIHLEPTGQSYTLPREFILESLPNSLLANALELDPTATEIRIPNPAVTPAVMQFLVDFARGREPNTFVWDLGGASRYLNIPWSLYYSEGYYERLNRDNLNDPANRPIIERMIKNYPTDVYAYMLTKGYRPHYDDLVIATLQNDAPLQALINAQVTFPPLPDPRDMIAKVHVEMNNFTPLTGHETLDNIRGRENTIAILAEMSKLIANGDYEAAYHLLGRFGDYEDFIPADVRDILTYLYNRESLPPSAYPDIIASTRWIPPMTD